jgi:hypothetical protein
MQFRVWGQTGWLWFFVVCYSRVQKAQGQECSEYKNTCSKSENGPELVLNQRNSSLMC